MNTHTLERKFFLFSFIFWNLCHPWFLNATELTVCDGIKTNECLPIYGYYLDSKPLHQQMIYPATLLENMKGKDIEGLTFYIHSSSATWSHEKMKVSLGESPLTTFQTADYITDNIITTFSNSIEGKAGEDVLLTVLFDFPFLYEGGNLVIDFETEIKGNNCSKMFFYGTEQSFSTAIHSNSWGYNSVLENFLPKVTFTYGEPQEYSVEINPENVNFPQTIIGNCSTLPLTIQNKGVKPLNAHITGLDNTAFHLSDIEKLQNIDSGTKIEIPVIYTPTTEGRDIATLVINIEEVGTFNIELSGTSISIPVGYQETFDNITTSSILPAGWMTWSVIENTTDQTIRGKEDESKYGIYNQNDIKGITLSGVNPNNDYWSKTKTSYYLISPCISGEICLFVKKSSDYSTATVKFYPASLENDTCIIDENEIIVEWSTPLSNNEWSIVKFSLPQNKHIAIFLNYVAIDLFAADHVAGNEAILLEQFIKIPTSVVVNSQGKAIIPISLSIKNNGLSSVLGKAYSLGIYDLETPETKLKEIPGVDIPVGKTVQKDFEFDCLLPDLEGMISKRFIIKENISGTSLTTDNIDIYPYKPYLSIIEPESDLEITDTINLGLFKGQRSIPLQIKNTGTAPLTIKSIDLMEKIKIVCPIELNNLILNSKESITIELLFTEPAIYKGKALNIHSSAEGITSLTVEGECLEDNVFFEDFEADLSKKWLLGSWGRKSRESYPYNAVTDYNKSLICTTNSSDDILITPELTFNNEVGTNINLSVFAIDRNSSLTILYSKDRLNWEKVSDITFAKIQAFETKKIILPEGQYYLGIQGSSVAIDDIYGARLAPEREHDCMITKFTGPQKGMVNHTTSFDITIYNMLETSDDFHVALKEDGMIIDEALVENLLKEESLTLDYTPHRIGNHQLQVAVSTNNYSLASIPQAYIAEQERADLTISVNEGWKYAEGIPINTYYDHSASKLLYKPMQLEGLSTGMKIVSIAFKHYYANDLPVWHNIKLWGGNTDIDLLNNNRMSNDDLPLLYTGKCIPDGTKEKPSLLTFDLLSPIIYNGGNLEFIIAADSISSARNINFCYNEASENQVEYYQKDCGYTETYTEAPEYFEKGSYTLYSSKYLPILMLYVELSPGIVTGIVTGKDSPVEAATITFREGAKIYSATTDENGQYTTKIYQVGDNYTVTVEKEGYKKYTESVQITAGEQTKNFIIEISDPVSIEKNSSKNISHYLSPDGILHITSEEILRKLTLTSSMGAILLEKTCYDKNIVLNMKQYRVGLYLITLKTDKRTYTYKVTKR